MVLVEGSGAGGEKIVGDSALASQRRSQVLVPPTFSHSFVTHVRDRQQPLEPAICNPVADRMAVDMLGDHPRRRRFVVGGDVPQGAAERQHRLVAHVDASPSSRRSRSSPSTRSLLPNEVATAMP